MIDILRFLEVIIENDNIVYHKKQQSKDNIESNIHNKPVSLSIQLDHNADK